MVVLYLGVAISCVRVLGMDQLRASKAPALDVATLALGPRGAALIAAGIAVSSLGFLSQSILTAPRVYFAMADDGLSSAAWRGSGPARAPRWWPSRCRVRWPRSLALGELRAAPVRGGDGLHLLRAHRGLPLRVPGARGALSNAGAPMDDALVHRHLRAGGVLDLRARSHTP